MNYVIKCEHRNGVRKPQDGTLTIQIWKIMDRLTDERNGDIPLYEEVQSMLPDVNKNTVSTQYGNWLRFHGIKIKRGDIKNGKQFNTRS